jgi:hypothetical protein
MKPLLRAVLVIDALLLLAFGLLFLLTPWASLYDALQLVQTEPVLVAQAFGLALIGLAWLALHASIDGALTSTVSKVVGHVNWLTGVLMLVWLLGLHKPSLTGFGQLVGVLVAGVLLLLGLGGVRLAGTVRRRERVIAAEAVAAARADRLADRQTAKDAVVTKREANQAARDEARADAQAARARASAGYAATTPVVEPVLRPAADPAVAAAREREAARAAEQARANDDVPREEPRPPFHG